MFPYAEEEFGMDLYTPYPEPHPPIDKTRPHPLQTKFNNFPLISPHTITYSIASEVVQACL